MNLWLLATLGYLGAAVLTFVPVALALLRRIQLHDGGDGPDESPVLSEAARIRLRQNHSRLLGTLKFWKKRAECYKRFHYYSLGWIIPSSVLVPVLTQAITQDPYSKYFLSVVAAFSTILLSFQRLLKVEQNYMAFRLGESSYYDLRRQFLDRPQSFGGSEPAQLEAYFLQVEELRRRVRDAEIDNFPTSDVLSAKPQAGANGGALSS